MFEICKFVIRAEGWMRLAIAFHLRDLINRLPSSARLSVGRGQLFAVHGLAWEHHAVREIAVVSNGHHFRPGFVFHGLERVPQVSRIRALL